MRTAVRRSPALLASLLAALLVVRTARAEGEGADEGAGLSALDPRPVAEEFDEIPVEEMPEAEMPVEELGEIIVTGTRVKKLEFEVPRAVNVVDARQIRERGVTTIADALDGQVGIWVEKRTAHTADPVIRGLSGSNLLALIDGNSLSTFWGEGGFAGDDMYGKIDPDNIERIEVVRGPTSVLYGSNALGGVINFITRESPFDYTSCGIRLGARSRVQVNTAPSGWRVRQEGFGASPCFRWIAGVTYLDIGTTRDGSGRHQTPTAARGWYADAALNWKVSRKALAKFTVQYTNLDPIYRYYRPTQSNADYRLALAAEFALVDLERTVGFADDVRFSLYYQDKEDKRWWHDAATKEVTKWGVARWKTVQAEVQAVKQLTRHELTYGLEFENTDGESPDDEQFTMYYPDGRKEKDAPDSMWSSLGGYVQDVWRVNPCLTLTGAARFDVFRFDTDVDQYYHPAGGLDPYVDQFEEWQTALVGGLQATVHLSKKTNLYGGWARGFRQFAPRFGVTQHAWGVIVPTGFLSPVTGDQFELGIKHETEYVRADLVGYVTLFNNFQNVVPGTFQGQDWYDYNGSGVRDPGEDVYVTVGNGDAYVYGFEAYSDLNLAAVGRRFFGEAWTLSGSFTYNYGQDETNDVPLRHTQPMAGIVKVRWEPPTAPPRLWFELAAKFVGRFDRIPPDRLAHDVGYLRDPQDPTSGMLRTWGLPGYSVFDLRGGFLLNDRCEITVGLNNIFDKLYRPAHARWNAPGRNFYASLTVTL